MANLFGRRYRPLLMAGCQSLAVLANTHRPLVAQESTTMPAEETAGDEPKRIVIIDNIPYRDGDSDAWRLDLAMPENFGGERHPAIVIVHGGGWRAGSKQDRPYRKLLTHWATLGYTVISVDYRLFGEAPLPACIEDVKTAVRWLRAHADEYHVDPDRIGVYGHSAGAHLAMMLALVPESAGMEGEAWGEYSSAVQAAAGGATPIDVGRPFGEGSEKYAPLTYVTEDVVPILLIQGSEDRIVTAESVERFVDALKEAGNEDVTYLLLEGGNHGTAFEHFMQPSEDALEQFFARTLKGDEPTKDAP